MGDCQNGDLRVDFERTLKLKFLGSKVTTDAGLLAYRELDEAFSLTEMGGDDLKDSRLGKNKQHGLLPLLRQSTYSRLAGYEDVNDAQLSASTDELSLGACPGGAQMGNPGEMPGLCVFLWHFSPIGAEMVGIATVRIAEIRVCHRGESR